MKQMMCGNWKFSACLSMSICGIFISLLVMNVYAGPFDEQDGLPITPDERQFVERAIAKVEKAFPLPGEKWTSTMQVRIQKSVYHEKNLKTFIREDLKKRALPISIHLEMRLASVAEVRRSQQETQADASREDLQRQLMAAMQRLDEEEVSRISQKMLAPQMGAGQSNGEDMSGPGANENEGKEKKLEVQIKINNGGETIGKKYEKSVPGVTRAFLIQPKGRSKYKYYFGPWLVRGKGKANLSIKLPEGIYRKENHVRALVMMVKIFGDRDEVDSYVQRKVDIRQLASIVK